MKIKQFLKVVKISGTIGVISTPLVFIPLIGNYEIDAILAWQVQHTKIVGDDSSNA
jgi:hypothetical protein